MTDEKDLEYAVQHVCLNCSELGECDKGVHCEFLKIVRECYDDAIEIGRKEKWHDLRKNPNDLPTNYYEDWVLVIMIDCVSNEIYMLPNIAELRTDGWYKDDFNNTKISKETTLSEVIAWCELPQFKE